MMSTLVPSHLSRRAARGALAFSLATWLAASASAEEIAIEEALVVRGADWYRSHHRVDPVEARLVAGDWAAPREGDRIETPDEERRWHRVAADESGWISHPDLANGYAYASASSPVSRVMILEGFGYQLAYVNGEPRAGNLYGYKDQWEAWEPRFDFSRVPVALSEGRNDLLLLGARGDRFKARLVSPPSRLFFNARDATVPDLLVGEPVRGQAAVVLVNASRERIEGARLRASMAGSTRTTELPPLLPLSVRKIPFEIEASAPSEAGERPLELSVAVDGDVLDACTLELPVREPLDNHRRTFVSEIDGSVQFFGVLPARGESPAALFLSVHGAGVDAFNQSGAYAAKSWGHVVAPTNRRPFGFNWEDWGRLDALEVLEIALDSFAIDESRVYLTGHSMGGHGTWHLGALYPDRFAALGPSAGWISFWSYRPSGPDVPETEVERLLARCTLPSQTLELAENYADHGVYVLHGADDDNVPAGEARSIVKRLEEFHRDFVYHEEPGVGHWWDKNDEPGTDCVDWAPLFDFFARHARPEAHRVRRVAFRTPNPGVSSSHHWARVEAQQKALEMSVVELRMDPEQRRFVGTTENVARLGLTTSFLHGEGDVTLELDGHTLIATPRDSRVTLHFANDEWTAGPSAPAAHKGPHRAGTFKDAFDHRVLFVYGTGGSSDENAWAFAKSRFDAEHFWYQANGSIEVIADRDFDPAADPDRNVVLYGNSRTNGAWKGLLASSPVQVSPGAVAIGSRRLTGDDLGVLLVRPRPDSEIASVGAVAGSGLVGMRLTDRRPYLSAGFAYPDVTVFRAPSGDGSGSVAVVAGFFGNDWSLESGEFAAALEP